MNKLNQVKKLMDGPFISILSAILIPVILTAYSLLSMKIKPSFTGMIDHILFIFLFYLIFNAILELRNLLACFSLSFLLVFITSLFFMSNTLYFRFFNAWENMEMARLWKDIPALWVGILGLTDFFDYTFYLFIPIFLWQLSLRYYIGLSRKIYAGLILAILLSFTGHFLLNADPMSYLNSNPFLYMLRIKSMGLSLTRKKFGEIKISNNLSQYQMINSTLYERSKDDQYPFLKIPKPNPPPLGLIKGHPNVVLVLMESMRAYNSGAYGAHPSVTPNLDKLSKDSVFFKNFYSVSNQTVRAEFSILCSFHPNVLGAPIYVSKDPPRFLSLPAILKTQGYRTIWIEAECGVLSDMKINFLSKHGVESFYTDVPQKHPPLGLGNADEDTFEYALEKLSKEKNPFFAEIMTLSGHWPNDADFPTNPTVPRVTGDSHYKNYIRGMYYADYAVGTFIEKVKHSSLYGNTIFLFTGDHGLNIYPDGENAKNPIRRKEMFFRSPFLIWAPGLLKPEVKETLASAIDIAPTVLDLLDIHVRNAFMGTSLFRNDTGPRRVLMVEEGRWNIRLENSYAYTVGSSLFQEIAPFNAHAQSANNLGWSMENAVFKYDGDLLQEYDPNKVAIANRQENEEFKNLGENIVSAYHSIIKKNQIYPETLGPAPSEKVD